MNGATHRTSGGGAFDIAGLLTPDAFPHPVDELTLKETHISWIVLTGPFAYKVKKPVRLDFIDASTLDRRRHLCVEEVRLNRRLAPELYVDVVPLTLERGRLRLGGEATAIEYAVRMRQFDTADEMPCLLASRQVSVEQMQELADAIASFHARAPAARTNGHFTHTHRLLNTVRNNLAELGGELPEFAPAPELTRIADWMHDCIQRYEMLFEHRERCGYIRECHGDLHTANIVRFRGQLVPFDCLEFDPDLRWIDVVDDIAFLIMDLASHARDDLATALLSRYLEAGGDYAGIRLLPFYAAHRALVRAKVDALSARNVPARAEEFRERLQRRLRTAVHWSRSKQPTLILMHGVSGSGKSWLSERLVATVPAIRVRSDLERKRLAGVEANKSTAAPVRTGIYTPEISHRTYAHLSDCAEACLQAGFNVIVDATFLDVADRELFRNLASRMGSPYVIVSCTIDRARAAERIAARAATGDRTSEADIAVLDMQLENAQPFTSVEHGHVVTVDTHAAEAVERAVAEIHARSAKA